jgi:hypothetical protein
MIIIFMKWAVFGLFRALEEYVGPSTLAVGVLYFVSFSGYMLVFSSESACRPFVARDIPIVIWIL